MVYALSALRSGVNKDKFFIAQGLEADQSILPYLRLSGTLSGGDFNETEKDGQLTNKIKSPGVYQSFPDP